MPHCRFPLLYLKCIRVLCAPRPPSSPPRKARALGLGVAVASSGSPDKIARNLGSSGLARLFPDPRLVRWAVCGWRCEFVCDVC